MPSKARPRAKSGPAKPATSPRKSRSRAHRTPDLRIGHGYDLHRLEPRPPAGQGRALVLGGVALEAQRGPVSHSDGDALLHALTDAILGALARPDIGRLFPDSDDANRSQNSADFLRHAVDLARRDGWAIVNADATVILERPKLAPAIDRLRASVAGLLGVTIDRVGLKAKTHEGVDAVGEGRAIEVHAVALLSR